MSVTRMAGVAAAFGRDLDFDLARITTIIDQARRAGVALLVLPDAALGGYLSDLRRPNPDSLPPALAPDDPMPRTVAFVGTGVLALAVLASAVVSAHRRKDTAS